MSYRVVKPKKPPAIGNEIIEVHYHPKAVTRACLILAAQEIQHGRVADYRVEPPTFCRSEELNLPDWVKKILALT